MNAHTVDVIADVHGCSLTLEGLLTNQLGYREHKGIFVPPQSDRIALFLGDLIDRGPDSLGVYRLVRSMVDAGYAEVILGNHELNALAWHTRCPDNPDSYLRPHSDKNREQHQATLDSFADARAERDEMLAWLMDVPLWLDTGSLRAIHACWHPPSLRKLRNHLSEKNTIQTVSNLAQLTRKDGAGFEAAETTLKGLEMDLPDGRTFLDKDSNRRSEVRLRWWLGGETLPFQDAVLADKSTIEKIPSSLEVTIPPQARYPTDQIPVFFGHYWLPPDSKPAPQNPNVACLDYSVGKSGPLVAYSYSGEQSLRADHFVVQKQMDLAS